MRVRPAEPRDAAAWALQRAALWPEDDADAHREEVDRFFAGTFPREPWGVLVAEEDGRMVGFVELSVRPFAEGCRSHRVAYLEGWFVLPEARGRGVGKALVRAAMDWGRRQGSRELASDAAPENELSRTAHLALGFEDVGLVRCFRMDL